MKQHLHHAVVRAPIQGLDEEKYRGQWLVIDGKNGQILINGDNLEDLRRQAKQQAVERPVYYKVPQTEVHHVVVR